MADEPDDLGPMENLTVAQIFERLEIVRYWVLEDRVPVIRSLPYLIKSGSPWLERHDELCRVGLDQVGDCTVSTVFLSMLALSADEKREWLFETLTTGGHLSGGTYRYETWEEAEAGHRNTVEWLRQREKDGK